MKKKVLNLILVVAMLLGATYVLTGCGSSDNKDSFIKSKYHNEDLNDKLHSDKSIVHSATRDLFKYATEFRNSGTGRTIHDKLLELRDYRNSVDYDSNKINNLIFYARRSEVDSKKIFNLIQDLEQINI